jgi:tetratricopeptide (TPR) repeat protein
LKHDHQLSFFLEPSLPQRNAYMMNEDKLHTVDEQPTQTNKPAGPGQHIYALIILSAGILTYLNSFEGVLVFDDLLFINANIQNLWQATFAGDNLARPLIGFTLGINYLISGFHTWSYHLLNLLVHILAALTLFGIVRRTLLSERLREAFGERASRLALVVALIWLVHPLQTQSVTYIIQRCESIMGMFYLLTLYCAVRSFTAERRALWYALAITACAAGMLSKQVMVTAPIMVLVYDFMFVSGSLKTAVQKRWGLYAGLAATWGLLVATFLASPVNKTAGFSTVGPSPLQYFLSEFRVLVHYLRLAIYPDALAIDYGWKPAVGIGEVLPYAVPIIALQVATLWGLIKGKPMAFLGAWFFGILAVTSSFMPFSDLVFEHRMYLPLAAVVVAVVLGVDQALMRWLRRRSDYAEKWMRVENLATLATVTVLVATFVTLTVRRNMDYKNLFVLWQDTVNKQPENARAHNNYGKMLMENGELELAMREFTEALKYDTEFIEAYNNYGRTLQVLGRPEEAETHILKALSLQPNFAVAHCNLGYALMDMGRYDEAVTHFLKSVEINPGYVEAHYKLGTAFDKQGRYEEALASYHKALQLDPGCVDALNDLAGLLLAKKSPQPADVEEAMRCAQLSVQITRGQYGKSLDVLAQVYAAMGRYAEALEIAQQAAGTMLASVDKEFAEGVEARLKTYREKADAESVKGEGAVQAEHKASK